MVIPLFGYMTKESVSSTRSIMHLIVKRACKVLWFMSYGVGEGRLFYLDENSDSKYRWVYVW